MATRTLVASDSFNRAAGAIGANWGHIRNTANQPAPPEVDTGGTKLTARDSGNNYQVARWVGTGSFGDDQYAKITILGMSFQNSNYRLGVVARCSADTNTNADFYAFWVVDDAANGGIKTAKLVKMVNGTETAIRSITTVTWTNSDTVELEVEGSSLRTYKNGALLFTDTDSDIASGGFPGLLIGGDNNVTPYGDDWEGGSLGAPAATSSLPTLGTGIYQPPMAGLF